MNFITFKICAMNYFDNCSKHVFKNTSEFIYLFMLQYFALIQKVQNIARIKGRDPTQPFDKILYTNRKLKKQSDNTRTQQKCSTTKQLRSDLGL